MEGKAVILSLLILSHVMAQVQVEGKLCCPSKTARNIYNTCLHLGGSQQQCASLSGCIIISSSTCIPPYDHETLENSGGHTMNEYCKLRCASSLCTPITTLQTSGEVMNEVVEDCIKACSEFCTKGSIGAHVIV